MRINLPKKKHLPYLASLLLLLGLTGMAVGRMLFSGGGDRLEESSAVALDWHRHALRAEQVTEGWRGPVAARMYGYLALAAYEAAVPLLNGEYRSVAHLFPELKLPAPDPSSAYDLPAVLNACYSTLLGKFFATAPEEAVAAKKALEDRWTSRRGRQVHEATLLNSQQYGQQVAAAVFAWSATDSLGYRAYLHLYDRTYVPPKGEGLWKPCLDFPLPALLPHWGKVRPFIIQTEDYLAKPLPAYSTEPGATLYTQALEVFTLNSPLSNENLWIAEFWSDDQPGLTFTPIGRWISITNQVLETATPDIGKTLETYLKVSFALHDATVAAWHSKYIYNLERPEAYIAKVFDADWRPVHHTPPFPAYPSGHSMMGAAAAEVLTQLFGQRFELTDHSHAGRTEFKGMPRKFHSFYEMAFENAFSRILLGVHFRTDCEEGIRLGFLIGKEVGKLHLYRDARAATQEFDL